MTFDENAVRRRLDALAKPPRSLGRLEDLAVRLCVAQQSLAPQTRPRRAVLFAADHGVVDAGVTAWPREVTGLVTQTIVSGRGASSALARASQTELIVVDVGLAKPLALAETRPDESPASGVSFRSKRVRSGTRNLAVEAALTPDEFQAAYEIGRELANEAQRDGMRVVAAGEMGIGNTTSAACLAMLLAGAPVGSAVGRGAGVDDAGLVRKQTVVATAVEREHPRLWGDPRSAIA
ncbi:MAG TPA: nicotinate-nucleotide--dimethylbenzimidazole phosphoribosyltransferase, partial [Pirellulales bacterium]